MNTNYLNKTCIIIYILLCGIRGVYTQSLESKILGTWVFEDLISTIENHDTNKILIENLSLRTAIYVDQELSFLEDGTYSWGIFHPTEGFKIQEQGTWKCKEEMIKLTKKSNESINDTLLYKPVRIEILKRRVVPESALLSGYDAKLGVKILKNRMIIKYDYFDMYLKKKKDITIDTTSIYGNWMISSVTNYTFDSLIEVSKSQNPWIVFSSKRKTYVFTETGDFGVFVTTFFSKREEVQELSALWTRNNNELSLQIKEKNNVIEKINYLWTKNGELKLFNQKYELILKRKI